VIGLLVVLVVVVVVVVFGCGSVRDTPVEADSCVLRVVVGVWGCALVCGGGVVRVVVVLGMWCIGVVVGVVAIVGCGCVGACGCLGSGCVWAMVVCCYVWGYYVVVVVVVIWVR
jgi:hypothetical protein